MTFSLKVIRKGGRRSFFGLFDGTLSLLSATSWLVSPPPPKHLFPICQLLTHLPSVSCSLQDVLFLYVPCQIVLLSPCQDFQAFLSFSCFLVFLLFLMFSHWFSCVWPFWAVLWICLLPAPYLDCLLCCLPCSYDHCLFLTKNIDFGHLLSLPCILCSSPFLSRCYIAENTDLISCWKGKNKLKEKKSDNNPSSKNINYIKSWSDWPMIHIPKK